MKKWPLILATLIIITTAAVLYTNYHPTPPEPNFQLTNVEISNPTIKDRSTLIFYGYIYDSCSFYYTAREPTTCKLILQNPNSPKSVILTRYTDDDLEVVEHLNIAPYATYPRIYDLLKGKTLSGTIEVSGGDKDLHLGITYDVYNQSVDFSSVLSNTGSSEGFAVVELRSDGESIWSSRYFLAAGGSVSLAGVGSVPDRDEHIFDLVIVLQEK